MIVDDDFADAILDSLAGPGIGPGLPDEMWVALYDDNPADGGVEVAGGGYARLGPVDMTDGSLWPAAVGRAKSNAVQIPGPLLTGPLDDEATWAAFVDTATGPPGVTGYAQQLPEPVPGAAGDFLVLDPGDVTLTLSDIGSY